MKVQGVRRSGDYQSPHTLGKLAGIGVLVLASPFSAAAQADLEVSPFAERLGFFRFLEDYSDVPVEDRQNDRFASLKNIPLGASGVHLSVGGDYRFRLEHFDNAFFGLTPTPDYDQRLNRYMLHADLHAGAAFRAFVQMSAFTEEGREPGPGPFDESEPDVQQAFVDIGPDRAKLRVGRQELVLGSGKLSDIREGPNQRQSFDAVRGTMRLAAGTGVDVFYARDVIPSDDAFEDSSEDGTRFWGVYGSKLWSPLAGAALDAYYFGIDREQAIYDVGTGNEVRHSVGVRILGETGRLGYEYEAIYQFGEFDGLTIDAWGLRTEHYYTLAGFPLEPKIGLIANVTSGDGAAGDGLLGTFDALFPNPSYTTEAAILRPRNLYELHPVVSFDVTPKLNILFEANFLWRVDTADAVYAVPGFSLVPGAASDERYIGALFDVVANWKVSPFVAIQGSYVHGVAGPAIRNAGGSDLNFFHVQAALKF